MITYGNKLPPMPAEIAKRVLDVMKAVGKLAKDSKNEQGRYDYTSVDAFLEMVGPACAEAGLIIAPIELSAELSTFEATDRDGKTKLRRQITFKYNFMLIAEDGTSWCNESDVRTVIVEATGAQASGAAQSYALKQYERGLFQIPTGDADADADDKMQTSLVVAKVQAARNKRETGKDQIIADFGNGPESIDAADAPARLLAHLKKFDKLDDAAAWWDHQKAGREQFFEKYPKLALQLKKDVEAFFSADKHEEKAA
jgi:hypothetical protein